jgi:hypothetical protein
MWLQRRCPGAISATSLALAGESSQHPSRHRQHRLGRPVNILAAATFSTQRYWVLRSLTGFLSRPFTIRQHQAARVSGPIGVPSTGGGITALPTKYWQATLNQHRTLTIP